MASAVRVRAPAARRRLAWAIAQDRSQVMATESGDPKDAALVLSGIDSVVEVLESLTSGDYSQKLEAHLPEKHPLRALHGAINRMVESLSTAQKKSLVYQQELEDKLATIAQQRAAI